MSIHVFCLLLRDVKLNNKFGFNHGVIKRFCMIAVSLKLKIVTLILHLKIVIFMINDYYYYYSLAKL